MSKKKALDGDVLVEASEKRLLIATTAWITSCHSATLLGNGGS
jgi:hypothetical protein